jgi:hypothetical protein
MSPDSDEGEDQLARDILEYFLRNPQAADSLEGVAHWRLLDQAINRTLADSQTALEFLVHEGFLRETLLPGSEPVYSLNQDKRGEAQQIVSSEIHMLARRPGSQPH